MAAIYLDDEVRHGACIKVIGVGGGGGNAVNSMIEAGVGGVEFIVANTDRQALSNNLAENRIQIGEQRTHGLGAGSNPAVGEAAAQESASLIQEQLSGADMVFVTAGMGGGTGTGAAPIIAGVAKQLGALTVGVVTKPFKFEGKMRRRYAEAGIAELKKNVDTLIVIPNERLRQTVGDQMTMIDAFREANSVLLLAVRAISELITKQGYVNTDFADVRTVMENKGYALMGTGVGSGPNRAVEAAEAAISSPLLDDISIVGATHILINITAPPNVTLSEISEAADLIEEAADSEALVIWGQVFSEDGNEDEVKVTIIATGFERLDADTPEKSRQANDKRVPPLLVSPGERGFGKSGVYQPAPSSTMQAADDRRNSQSYIRDRSGSYTLTGMERQGFGRDYSSGGMPGLRDHSGTDVTDDGPRGMRDPDEQNSQVPQRETPSYLPQGRDQRVSGSSYDSFPQAQQPGGRTDADRIQQGRGGSAFQQEQDADGGDDLEKPTFLRKGRQPRNFI